MKDLMSDEGHVETGLVDAWVSLFAHFSDADDDDLDERLSLRKRLLKQAGHDGAECGAGVMSAKVWDQ